MKAQDYEYVLLKFAAGTLAHMTERINQHAEDGYEPILMCGDEQTTILLRRLRPTAAETAPTG